MTTDPTHSHCATGLRVLAVNILGKFLTNKDNNIKYVALQTLCKVMDQDAPAVSRHRGVIVECLRDGDVSIRRRALELVYALVNADNVRLLVKEMLTYLTVAEADTKPELCTKIALVAERFAPNLRWHVDTLLTVLVTAGNIAKRELASALIYHIARASPEDHAAITHKLFALAAAAMAGSGEAQQSTLQVAMWCIGEYGDLLLRAPPARGQDDDLSGPYGEARSETAVILFLERMLVLFYATGETRGMVLTAALKLTSRFGAAGSDAGAKLRHIIASFASSADTELQARSVEFSVIAEPSAHSLLAPHRDTLLTNMPLLEESVMRERSGLVEAGEVRAMTIGARTVPRAGTDGGGAAAAAAAANTPSTAKSSLLELDELFSSVTSTAGTGDLASGAAVIAATQSTAPAVGSGYGLDDIFGVPTAPIQVPTAPIQVQRSVMAPPAMPAAAIADPFGLGFGAPLPSTQGAAVGGNLLVGGGAVSSPVTTILGGGGALPVAHLKAAPLDPFLSLTASSLGAPGPSTVVLPQPAAPVPVADLFSAFSSAAPAPAPPAPVLPSFTAFENAAHGLRVVFRCDKPATAHEPVSAITATFSTTGSSLSNFVFQVRRVWRLVRERTCVIFSQLPLIRFPHRSPCPSISSTCCNQRAALPFRATSQLRKRSALKIQCTGRKRLRFGSSLLSLLRVCLNQSRKWWT